MNLGRIITLIKRRKVASKLGIKFNRCATFHLPESMVLNGHMHSLSLPDENGVKVAFIDLLLDDCYGCHELKSSGVQIKTILDIGGNVGLFGLAARSVFPDAIIHSYEPNPSLEPYLMTQARSANFKYFIEAVGLENGSISLVVHEDSVQTYSKHDSDGNIPQIAFRNAIERLGGKIDLVKMDCEGAEWDILKDKDSWGRVQRLTMEYHLFQRDQTEQRIKSIIGELGFTITSLIPCGNFGLLTANKQEG